MAAPAVELGEIAASMQVNGMPVTFSGEYDIANAIVLSNRSRNGAPGVNILTPLRIPGSDSAVLVNRGWVYSPDARSVDLAGWHAQLPGVQPAGDAASDTLLQQGLLFTIPGADSPGASASELVVGERTVAQLTRAGVAELIPYPVRTSYVQLLARDSINRPGVPVPLPPPSLSSGPHMSYAIQWFSFAIIAVVGCASVLAHARRSPRGGYPVAPR
jgi:surfeit locus 1 family protein